MKYFYSYCSWAVRNGVNCLNAVCVGSGQCLVTGW